MLEFKQLKIKTKMLIMKKNLKYSSSNYNNKSNNH